MALTSPPADGSRPPCATCGGGGYDEHEIRCFDCFGSGVRGDGVVATYGSAEVAREVPCPSCEAAVGEGCHGDFPPARYGEDLGEHLHTVHLVRVRVALGVQAANGIPHRDPPRCF